MFKQIFENKIGEKLTNINNSGKQAFEWMDKFRQQLDITEKIQQQFNPNATNSNDLQVNNNNNNNLSNASSSASVSASSSNNISNDKPKEINNVQQKEKPKHLVRTPSRKPSIDSNQDDFSYTNGNHINNNNHNNNSNNNPSPLPSPKPSINNLATKNMNGNIPTDNENVSNGINDDDEFAFLKQASQQKKNLLSHLQQSKSIMVEDKTTNNTNNSKTLVRQATDLTSSFPLKSFQKINSETIEIPGLNVKVVRYRIENDLGRIEPHLYKNYSVGACDSNVSVSKSKLFFSLYYNEEIQSLSVSVNKAEIFNSSNSLANNVPSNNNYLNSSNNISAPNSPNLNKPDTYVKVQLLPDKKRKYQTKIQRKTFTPVFDETFYFQLPFDDLQNRTLILTHMEFGRFSKHELIGSVRLSDLHSIKDITSGEVELNKNLLQLNDDNLDLGELTLTLCYLPAAGRLTVTVVKAINLKSMDINGKSDPYVKVTIVSKGKRLKKKKTSVMKNTLHPVFNESMLFDIPQDQIDNVDMVVKVIDYDR